MFLLELKLGFDSNDEAKSFFDSIKPNLRSDVSQSVARVSQNGNELVFEITAGEKKELIPMLDLVVKSLQVFYGAAKR
jgi:tRNA threonylcarbamoyladenosine modification (KEOPS) complex  Pcc1 subunit